MLGVAEELLEKIAENLEPGKEGILRIQETLEESAFGFTDFGIDNVREILDDPPHWSASSTAGHNWTACFTACLRVQRKYKQFEGHKQRFWESAGVKFPRATRPQKPKPSRKTEHAAGAQKLETISAVLAPGQNLNLNDFCPENRLVSITYYPPVINNAAPPVVAPEDNSPQTPGHPP